MLSPYFDQSQLLVRLSLLRPILIQEQVAHDPWKLIVATTLLNKTTAKVAIPVFWQLMEQWPTPWALSKGMSLLSLILFLTLCIAEPSVLANILHPLGTYSIRSKRLIDLSLAYLKEPPNTYDPRPSRPTLPSPSKLVDTPSRRNKRVKYPATPISHLPGTGPYALDSYRIFCTAHEDPLSDEWKSVTPSDKELVRFLKWKWATIEGIEWSPEEGSVRPVTVAFLQSLIAELTPREASSSSKRDNALEKTPSPKKQMTESRRKPPRPVRRKSTQWRGRMSNSKLLQTFYVYC
ncbi:hypothetical protein D9758_000146 [Tetrapyrgos nigripes]|uniref:Uncharacterized protein n=1 Tax=Tetrapyrgos nigripes TaxID=182062 RepID=A0A8H5H1M1_9AGAR|nr:hypothetical protein D9758_000146 [Tetrapyrgos nigripes]